MKFLFSLLLFSPLFIAAQKDSCRLRISLLTADPGEALYSTFGHSALRVTDSANNTDIVYNYGTFNFDEAGFYSKFVRGKLNYYLSRDYFDSFKAEYQQENRTLTEQVLNLSCAEKQKIQLSLDNNLLPQNLFYKYDFLFDNCTTRLRDLVEKSADRSIQFNPVVKTRVTFRNLIHEYLDYNDKQWSKLGIDILLGSKTDAVMKPREVMFLPDYLMKTFDSSSIDGRQLVKEKEVVYQSNNKGIEKDNLSHPVFIFLVAFVIIAFLSFTKNDILRKILFSLDGMLFFITGLLGFLLLFMWFGTDHIMCQNNYNLLWAWPINVVAAFYTHSLRKGVKIYFLIYGLFNLILLILWFKVPQQLNISLMPLIGILIFRSLSIFRRKEGQYVNNKISK
ncbi:MAG: DUF4105 domain-containing protein [Ginsengibacter sp.]